MFPNGDRIHSEGRAMRTVVMVAALVASSTFSFSANAASQAAREQARAECVRQAAAMQFGPFEIQRRNFIRDCLIDRGFPVP
jgi:hypothetical protein